MMSVSAFHRFAMSEARPLGRPPSQKIDRVRKTLNFGDTDAPSAAAIASDEIAETLRLQSKRWNFDFAAGVPLNSASSSIQWTKLSNSDKVHESYALDKFPYLSNHTDTPSPSVDKPTTRSCSRQSSITDFLSKKKRSSGACCSKNVAPSTKSSSTSQCSAEESDPAAPQPAKKRRTSTT